LDPLPHGLASHQLDADSITAGRDNGSDDQPTSVS
jgi:hypothetical protein